MNCLRHELCLSAHWLQFNSWRRRHADEKSWRSQFMMRQHQFIYQNEQSKNRRIFSFYSCSFCRYRGLGLAILHLSGQMRCSHLSVFSNSPLRTSRIGGVPCFFVKPFYPAALRSTGVSLALYEGSSSMPRASPSYI